MEQGWQQAAACDDHLLFFTGTCQAFLARWGWDRGKVENHLLPGLQVIQTLLSDILSPVPWAESIGRFASHPKYTSERLNICFISSLLLLWVSICLCSSCHPGYFSMLLATKFFQMEESAFMMCTGSGPNSSYEVAGTIQLLFSSLEL